MKTIVDNYNYAEKIYNNFYKVESPDTYEDLLNLRSEQETNIKQADKAIDALNKAVNLSDTLFLLQDKLITYWTDHDYDADNVKIIKRNKSRAENNLTIIKSLKTRIQKKTNTFRTDLDMINKVISKQKDARTTQKAGESELANIVSIPGITNQRFRNEIFDYIDLNRIIKLKKPVVLIYYNADDMASIDYLKNVNEVYSKYTGKIDFYRISKLKNEEVISNLFVAKLPTTHFIGKDNSFNEHRGPLNIHSLEEKLANLIK